MQLTVGEEKRFQDWYAKNDDRYGRATFDYAIKWAELMEGAIADGKKLIDVAKELSHKADEGIGITGFMYGCAVSILADVWVHGEELRKWHNLGTQVHDEGQKANESGGVLNPALMSVDMEGK